MRAVFSDAYKNKQSKVENFISDFPNDSGELFGKGERNKIKLFEFEEKLINIKSFKVPNFINQVIYKFFRRSKAERSFTYAQHLIANEIGTPYPIAYAVNNTSLLFKDSYYISEHLPYDLTYRELVTDSDYPNHEKILRAFTHFTFLLHEKNIEFLDHSPGNTLIQLNNGDYKFFLVDLNRMKFKALDFEARMKNFSRLTPEREMVEIMAREYASLIKVPSDKVFERMWFYTQDFQKKFQRKRELKRKLKGIKP